MAPPTAIRYDIILVSHNSSRWLRDCVQALAALDYPLQQLHLIAVDNASTDGTVEQWAALQREFCEFGGFTVQQSGANLGFGAGCNRGASLGSAELLLFLNLDTRIRPDALRQLDCGIALHPEGGMWEMRQYPQEAEKWYDPVTLETHWCSGAAVAMPRALFAQLGGFDEAIFMYCEDVDLSWRVRAAGKQLFYLPRAQVEHFTAETYEGKPDYANRNILQNNYYLRLKYGTRADRAAFWELFRQMEHRPEWATLTAGLEQTLRRLPRPQRLRLPFPPTFVGLSYDPYLYAAPGPCGPLEAPAPKISLLIRTHGRPQLLRQALQTVANQTVQTGFEVIVIEDGAPDGQAVIKEFASLPLRYCATGTPVGRSAAGNMALQLAAGEYFCFLDDDDWLLANYLECWQRLCLAHPGHRLFFAGSMQLAGGYAADGITWQTRRATPLPTAQANRLTVGLTNPVPVQAVLFHCSLYRQLGGFDEELDAYEDWNLWQRYAAAEPPIGTDQCTSVFKVPADPVELARRELRMRQHLPLCLEKGSAYPVQTSMGQLAQHALTAAQTPAELLAHAEEHARTAREIAASRLWRLTAPLRIAGHGLMRLGGWLCGLEAPSPPRSPEQAESTAEQIAFTHYALHSLSWQLTNPLRRSLRRPTGQTKSPQQKR